VLLDCSDERVHERRSSVPVTLPRSEFSPGMRKLSHVKTRDTKLCQDAIPLLLELLPAFGLRQSQQRQEMGLLG
jgi:hypothetical protein